MDKCAAPVECQEVTEEDPVPLTLCPPRTTGGRTDRQTDRQTN